MKPEEMKEIRNKLGVSQEKLAQILEVSFTTVNRLENGKAEIDSKLEEQLLGLKEIIEHDVDKAKLIKSLSKGGLAGLLGAAAISGFIKSALTDSLKELFEVADELNVKPESMIKSILKGELKAQKVGDKYYISEKDYLTLMENPDDGWLEHIDEFKDTSISFIFELLKFPEVIKVIKKNDVLYSKWIDFLNLVEKYNIYVTSHKLELASEEKEKARQEKAREDFIKGLQKK